MFEDYVVAPRRAEGAGPGWVAQKSPGGPLPVLAATGEGKEIAGAAGGQDRLRVSSRTTGFGLAPW